MQIFKSVIDEDRCPVVICDPEHTVLYLNPAAVARYKKYGGAALVGKSLLECHNPESCRRIGEVLDWFSADQTHNRVFTYYDPRENKDVYMVALRDGDGTLIGYYEKHECRTRETAAPYTFR